jgi:hypothetical protein
VFIRSDDIVLYDREDSGPVGTPAELSDACPAGP